MTDKKVQKETVKVSRLGCIRRSTIVTDEHLGSVEHVEVWVPEEDSDASGKEPGDRDRQPKK